MGSSEASNVYSSVSTSRARMLGHGSGESVESRQIRMCCSEQSKYKCRQRQLHHAVDGTTDAVELTQVELCHLEKCDLRIKDWEAREIQLEVRVDAKHECLLKWVSRLKHERNEEVLRDCLCPQYYTNPGVSPWRRRTERAVRRDSCGKVHIVFTEGDDVRVLGAIASFKTGRQRVVQTSSRVMCDSCERSVSAVQGCLFSDSGQSQFKREQFIRAGCLTLTGVERWEFHECNKLGHLRQDCSVYKKRITEKGNKSKRESELKQQLQCKE